MYWLWEYQPTLLMHSFKKRQSSDIIMNSDRYIFAFLTSFFSDNVFLFYILFLPATVFLKTL